MSITIGRHTFDNVHYDEDGDVLYLHKGDPSTAVDWDDTPEGDGLRFGADGAVVGITIIRPRARLERHGKIDITIPRVDLRAPVPSHHPLCSRPMTNELGLKD